MTRAPTQKTKLLAREQHQLMKMKKKVQILKRKNDQPKQIFTSIYFTGYFRTRQLM